MQRYVFTFKLQGFHTLIADTWIVIFIPMIGYICCLFIFLCMFRTIHEKKLLFLIIQSTNGCLVVSLKLLKIRLKLGVLLIMLLRCIIFATQLIGAFY